MSGRDGRNNGTGAFTLGNSLSLLNVQDRNLDGANDPVAVCPWVSIPLPRPMIPVDERRTAATGPGLSARIGLRPTSRSISG